MRLSERMRAALELAARADRIVGRSTSYLGRTAGEATFYGPGREYLGAVADRTMTALARRGLVRVVEDSLRRRVVSNPRGYESEFRTEWRWELVR